MTPKPLSPADRFDIEEEFTTHHIEGSENWFTGDDMRAVLSAEQYWREAVKNADPICENELGRWCMFCRGYDNFESKIFEMHQPDCPWLAANEAKE